MIHFRLHSSKQEKIMIGRVLMALLLAPLFSTLPTATLAKEQSPERMECVRSIPRPIINKSVFPNTKFVLKNIDTGGVVVPLGLETVEFENGDRLIITNGGCEYFTLSFQFETSQFARKITDTKYWFARSVELMRQIETGIDPSVNIQQGIQALENYTLKNPHPSIGQEIDYGGQEIRSFVALTEVKRLTDQKFTVIVNFSVGPL
jgi:hypothetical protein